MNGRRFPGEIPISPARPGYGRNSEVTSAAGASTASRAEKFEDEKRRIMGSCFAKVDGDGIRMLQCQSRLLTRS